MLVRSFTRNGNNSGIYEMIKMWSFRALGYAKTYHKEKNEENIHFPFS